MKIVGCDLHTCYQPIAMMDQETGELVERRREHANGEAPAFYTELEAAVRVGITGTLKTVNIDRQRPAQPCLGFGFFLGVVAFFRLFLAQHNPWACFLSKMSFPPDLGKACFRVPVPSTA